MTRDFTRSDVPDDEVRQSGKSAWAAYIRIYVAQVKVGDDQLSCAAGEGSPLLWKAIIRAIVFCTFSFGLGVWPKSEFFRPSASAIGFGLKRHLR